jgi:hypothetical protein
MEAFTGGFSDTLLKSNVHLSKYTNSLHQKTTDFPAAETVPFPGAQTECNKRQLVSIQM